jgi:hypothetical protein
MLLITVFRLLTILQYRTATNITGTAVPTILVLAPLAEWSRA